MTRRLVRTLAASLTVASLAGLIAPDSAGAQGTLRSGSRGLTLGLGFLGSSITTNFGTADVTESGGGLNLEVGWGFTPKLTVFLGGNAATIDADFDYTLSSGELGLRYLFRDTDKKARPYLEGALSTRQIRADVTDGAGTLTIKASSPGIAFGGGVQVFFTPKVALDLGASFAPGSFSEWTANGVPFPYQDVDARSTNVRLGVRFWPMGR